jgi:hypothetical protein
MVAATQAATHPHAPPAHAHPAARSHPHRGARRGHAARQLAGYRDGAEGQFTGHHDRREVEAVLA